MIVLSARQLPREFERRTIYLLLAKPISRVTFLAGKLAGVMLAATFCFALFIAVYVGGTLYAGGAIPWALFSQYVYLQLLMMGVLASLGFWLSMVLNLDAAITIGVLFYVTASLLITLSSHLYDYMSMAGKAVLIFLTYAVPQLTLFDLSEKTIHGETWVPLSAGTMGALTLYGAFFAACAGTPAASASCSAASAPT